MVRVLVFVSVLAVLFMAVSDFLSERDGGEAVGGEGVGGVGGGELKWDQAGPDTGPDTDIYHDGGGLVVVVIDGVRVMSCPVGQTVAYDPVTGERTKLVVVEDGE